MALALVQLLHRLKYLLENGLSPPSSGLALPHYYCAYSDFSRKGLLQTEDWPDLDAFVLTLGQWIVTT